MKQYLIILFLAAGFISCKKGAGTVSKLLVYNASHSIAALNAIWNGNVISATSLAQGQVSGTADAPYQNLPAGTNNLVLKSGTATLLDKNIYTSPAGGYSMLLYDTGATAGTGRVLILTDDLTLPDTFSIHIRLLQCVPDSGSIDVWLVNSTNADSLLLNSAAGFIGAAVQASAVQPFSTVKYHGGSCSVKIKQAGTGNLLASVNNYAFKPQEIYSIIYSGLPTGTGNAGLKLSILHHALK